MQAGCEREGVFHGEFGSRADGKVSRVSGIAKENNVVVTPAFILDCCEVKPLRIVRENLVALKLLGKDFTNFRDRVLVAHSGGKTFPTLASNRLAPTRRGAFRQ